MWSKMLLKNTMRKSFSTSTPFLNNLQKSNFSTLVLADQFEGSLQANFANTLSAAKNLESDKIDVLIHGGDSLDAQVESLKPFSGHINKVHVASHARLHTAYGDQLSHIMHHLVNSEGYEKVVAPSNGFGKDVLPRLGGMLDVQPITDVVSIQEEGEKFVRPIYAGNAMCTVSTSDKIKLVSVRTTNFEKA
jgi:electron transfer flavoprotein alpha subunit